MVGRTSGELTFQRLGESESELDDALFGYVPVARAGVQP